MRRAGLVALALCSLAHADDDPDVLFREGLALCDKREYAAARAKFGAALVIFEQRGFVDGCLGMHSQIASCFYEEGDYEKALLHYQKYCELLEQLPLADQGPTYKRDVAMARLDLGNILRQLERYPEALAVLQGAREVLVAFHAGRDDDDVALALHNEASCLQEMGRPMDALPIFEKAAQVRARLGLDRIPETPDPEVLAGVNNYAGSINSCAACCMLLGNAAEAESLFRQAWDLRSRILRAPHPILASMQANLGACLKLQGKLDEAMPWIVRAVTMLEALYPDGHPDLAQRISDLGSCVEAMRGPREALPHYRRSVAMLSNALPEDHSDVARARSNLGLCLMRLAAEEKSVDLQREGLQCLRAAADAGLRTGVPEAHMWLSNLGSTFLDLGRLDEAITPFQAAVDRVEAYRSWARRLPALERASYFGQTRTFDPFQGLALVAHRQKRPHDALLWLERGRAWAAFDLLDTPDADLARRAAGAAAPEDRKRILSIQEDLGVIDGKLLRATREAARAVEQGDREQIGTTQRALAGVRAEHARVLRERAAALQLAFPALRAPTPAEAPSLDANEIVLVYSLSVDGCFVVVLDGKDVRSLSLAGPDGSELREPAVTLLVRDYMNALAEERKAAEKDPEPPPASAGRWAASNKLYRALVPEPVRATLAGARWAVVVPDGPLHGLPFETLAVDDGRVWLDTGPPVAVARAVSILSRCRTIARAQRARADDTARKVVALGDPAFETKGRERAFDRGSSKRLLQLPGTRKEVDAIREVFGEVTTLLGPEATEAALWRAAPTARILHVGTHHIAETADQGRFSRLALAEPKDPTPEDDGALTLLDLIERWGGRLAGCEVVVLSACDSTRGFASRADGVFAMPLGFLHAGCPRVIGSLWPVSDEATVPLMADFYRGLAEGKSPLAALTEAKKAFRKRDPSPAGWGAFVLIGAPD